MATSCDKGDEWRLTLEEAEDILAFYDRALEQKNKPICNITALPFAKGIIKDAIWAVMEHEQDLDVKSALTMAYLSLADFQETDTQSGHDGLVLERVKESEELLDDIRGLDRGV